MVLHVETGAKDPSFHAYLKKLSPNPELGDLPGAADRSPVASWNGR
jgi:hypothetical protein